MSKISCQASEKMNLESLEVVALFILRIHECLFILTEFTNVTDGQTDRQTDGHRMTAYAALA